MPTRTVTYVEGADQIEITMGPGCAADPVEHTHHGFICDHWESLAAAAHEGFRRFGIGAVVVQPPDEGHLIPHPFATHNVWYATSYSPWMRGTASKRTSEWLAEQFETYEPRDACLFVFLEDEQRPRAYLATGSLRPVEASVRLKALLN